MLNLSTKSILKMTVPIMLGTFVQNIVMITDSVLVYGLGEVKFDAANNAGLLYVVFFMLSRGLGDGSQIQIAKEFGSQNFKEIKATLANSFFLQLSISVIIFALIFIGKDAFLNAVVQSEEIKSSMHDFLNYRTWGIIFAGLQASIMGFFIGIGKTRVIIYSTLILALSNIFLDYALIFGKFGFPAMGLKGAALASTIAEAITFIYLFIQLNLKADLKVYGFTKFRLKIVSYKSKLLLKLSSPLMLRGFISIGTWFVFFSLIEQMGKDDLAASHIVRNIFFVSFIPIFGFGAATRTYISYYFAKDDLLNIKRAIKKLTVMVLIFYLIIFHGALLYPDVMTQIYPYITELINPSFAENKIIYNPDTLNSAAEILKVIFGSMMLFAGVNIIYNTVSAVGKTMLALWIEIISVTFYLLATYLVILVWHWPVEKIWFVEYVYFSLIGILSGAYVLYFLKIQNSKTTVKHE